MLSGATDMGGSQSRVMRTAMVHELFPGTADAQLFHPVLESGAFDAEKLGGAAFALNAPTGLLQDA